MNLLDQNLDSKKLQRRSFRNRISLFIILFSVSLVLSGSQPVHAEEEEVPKVVIMQSGATRLLDDLKMVIKDIANRPKQWGTVEENIEIFLEGIDRDLPIRVDLLMKSGGEEYTPHFPIQKKKEKKFLKNLRAVGISYRSAGVGGIYKLRKLINGYLRFHTHDGATYGSISKERTGVPKGMPDPRTAIQKYITGGYDAAAIVTNPPEGMDKRKKSFNIAIDNLLAAIKKKKGESDQGFKLRKLAAIQQFREIERFFVQSKFIESTWNTDGKTKTGLGKVTLEAIPGTDLEKSILQACQAPSYFHAIPQTKKSVTSFRSNFPLDTFRKNQLFEFYKAFRPVSNDEIGKNKKLTKVQIEASQKANNFFLDMLIEGARLDSLDSFIEIVPAKGDFYQMTSGIRSQDGLKVVEILKLVPKMDPEVKVTLDIETYQGVALHAVKFTTPESTPKSFQIFYGKTPTFIIGSSKDAVWIGAGEGALDALKVQIDLVAKTKGKKPKEHSQVFLKLDTILLPLVKAYDLDLTKRKMGDKSIRKVAIDSLTETDGRYYGELKRDGKIVHGKVTIDEGVLKVLGRLIAKIADDNL